MAWTSPFRTNCSSRRRSSRPTRSGPRFPASWRWRPPRETGVRVRGRRCARRRDPLSGIDDEVLQAQVSTLYDQGLKSCRVTDQPAAMLAAASARQTLDTAGGQRVDAIVYCTDTAPDKTITGDVWDFLLALDLPSTPVTMVGGAGCGNLV